MKHVGVLLIVAVVECKDSHGTGARHDIVPVLRAGRSVCSYWIRLITPKLVVALIAIFCNTHKGSCYCSVSTTTININIRMPLLLPPVLLPLLLLLLLLLLPVLLPLLLLLLLLLPVLLPLPLLLLLLLFAGTTTASAAAAAAAAATFRRL